MKNFCVLFDLDGTLLDSGEGITNAVAYAIEKFGNEPLPLETRKRFVGPPLRESFMKYCSVTSKDAEEMLVLYREYYGDRGLFECRPYEGIEDLLIFLKECGSTIYVATAKPQKYAVKMLERWDLLKYFKEVIGASFDKSRDDKKIIIGEVIEKEKGKKAVMIGDTKYDIEAAHKNDIGAVAVTYGYGTEEEICISKPENTAKNVAELKIILKKLLADN